MFKRCPECESHDLEPIASKWSESGEMYEVVIFRCNKCGREFDEEEEE